MWCASFTQSAKRIRGLPKSWIRSRPSPSCALNSCAETHETRSTHSGQYRSGADLDCPPQAGCGFACLLPTGDRDWPGSRRSTGEATGSAGSQGARPTILITRQCAMLTVFELAGSMDVVGDAEFERITGDLQRALAAYFQRTGHSIEITFERDPQRMADTARRLMEPAYQTCARIGLDLKDMLDARCERIAALCAHEVCYVLLYTHLSALGPEAFKREMKAHQARIKACKIAPMRAAQSATAIIKGILHTHQTFIDAMEKDFRAAKLHVTRLSTTDAARAIRQSFDRCRTDDKWRPVLPGDPYTPRNPRHPTHDDLYLPKLSSQLCSGRIDVEGEYLCINGEYHGAATME